MKPPTRGPLPALAIAQIVARNVVPVAGILFLGWNATGVLLLYFADTLLALAVIMAGVMRHFAPVPEDDGLAARLNGEVGTVAMGLFVAAFCAVPLGVPIVFMLGGMPDIHALLSDPAFRAGLAGQVIAAGWSYLGLYRALRTATPDQLQLKHRFGLVLLRWTALLPVAILGVGLLVGRYAPLLFVAIYAVLMIWTELAPDRFLRVMPGGGDDLRDAAPARTSGRRAKPSP